MHTFFGFGNWHSLKGKQVDNVKCVEASHDQVSFETFFVKYIKCHTLSQAMGLDHTMDLARNDGKALQQTLT